MFDPENPYCLFRPGSNSFYALLGSCALFLLATPIFISLGGAVYFKDTWPSDPSDKGVAYGIGICFVIAVAVLMILGMLILAGLVELLTRLCKCYRGIPEEIHNSRTWAEELRIYPSCIKTNIDDQKSMWN